MAHVRSRRICIFPSVTAFYFEVCWQWIFWSKTLKEGCCVLRSTQMVLPTADYGADGFVHSVSHEQGENVVQSLETANRNCNTPTANDGAQEAGEQELQSS
ncbi:zinc finger protein [Sesbania bispinosa]|nr:zinc finger protein [Sesbania bispinosa]